MLHMPFCRRLTIFSVLVLCWRPGTSVAQSAREVAAKVSPSVVLLVMEDSNGQPLAMGSGFVIKEGIVATNLHVIEGASRGYAKLADRKEKLNIAGRVAVDTARDIALLAVDDIKAPALRIGDSTQLAVGDEVYAVGNPRGLEGTFSAGIISSVRKVGNDSLLQITAPISPGSSGGPVLNSKGEVIGVAVATFKGGQNLNFAIPSAYLSALTGQIKAAVPLTKASERLKDPNAKSILEDMGGGSTEGVEAAQFSWATQLYETDGGFTFSLRNRLRDPIKDVLCLVIFYDEKDEPLDIAVAQHRGTIPPGLAKRIVAGVDKSVKRLTTPASKNNEFMSDFVPSTKVEFRVLYFDIVTDDEPKEERGDAAPAQAPAVRDDPSRPAARREDVEAAVRELERQQLELEKKQTEIAAKLAPAGNGPDLIESQIEGDFEGWEGDTIFKLANGQIWQQVNYAYTYHYAFRPKVMIIKTNGVYKMKVDGVASTISVKRLK